MRQRITFIHKPEDAIDPKSIKITGNSLATPSLTAAREDKITLALKELPAEIRLVLEQSHELHIRYVAPFPYQPVLPFVSRLSPGLHVYFTPRCQTIVKSYVTMMRLPNCLIVIAKNISDLLCPLICEIFGLKDKLRCQTPDVCSPIGNRRVMN